MIARYINPAKEEWAKLCERMVADDAVIAGRVDAIIERVKRDGDKAVRELAQEIDGVELACIEVSDEEKRANKYLYEIVGVATHSETREPMMVYRPLYDDGGMFVRPLDM